MKQRWTWLVAGAASVVALARVSAQKPAEPHAPFPALPARDLLEVR